MTTKQNVYINIVVGKLLLLELESMLLLQVVTEVAVELAVAVFYFTDESLAPSVTEWCHACLRRFIMSSSKACQACR